EPALRDRLGAFSADFDGRQKQTLPAWNEFSAQFGSSRLTRQLFVEMQRAEPELLEALSKGTKSGSEALAERTGQIIEAQRESALSIGTVASLLFVGSVGGGALRGRLRLAGFPL